MAKHMPPIGDLDLSGAHPSAGENIRSGGAGPSGSDFGSTGKLGGLRGTADGVGSTGSTGEEDGLEIGGLTDSGITTTLGDIVNRTTTADADGSALDPEDAEADDDDDDDDADTGDDVVEDGSIEAPSVGSPTRDVERAGAVGGTETMRSSTGGLAGR